MQINWFKFFQLPLTINHGTTIDVLCLRIGLECRGLLWRQLCESLLEKRRITATAVTRNRWWRLNDRWIDIFPPPRWVISGEGTQWSRNASLPSICLVTNIAFIVTTNAIWRIGSIIVVQIDILRFIRRERSRRYLLFILAIRCRTAIWGIIMFDDRALLVMPVRRERPRRQIRFRLIYRGLLRCWWWEWPSDLFSRKSIWTVRYVVCAILTIRTLMKR